MNHHQQNNSRPTTSNTTGIMSGVPTAAGSVPGPGVAIMRGRGPPNVKVKRKCIEIVCDPCVIFLVSTIITTALASALLSMALTSRYWEMMVYDQDKLRRLFFENNTNLSVVWLFDGKIPRIEGTTGGHFRPTVVTSQSPQTSEPATATATANIMAKVNSFENSQQKYGTGTGTGTTTVKNSSGRNNNNNKNNNNRDSENIQKKKNTNTNTNTNTNSNHRNEDNYAFSTHPDDTDVSGSYIYSTNDNNLVFLLPLHSGVWISCIDLTEQEFSELRTVGYDNNVHCVDHLDPENTARKPTDARASWQHRMQNLAIACAMVCLILLGSAVVVGLFGILRRQISAVLVTGVLYALAAIFAIFTLTIVHLKHKNRQERDPLDVWTHLTPDYTDFRSARIISHGWSLSLAWGGTFICVLASIMWILLSKIMRYNPMSLRA